MNPDSNCETSEIGGAPCLPPDLSSWLGKPTLAHLALQAVQSLSDPPPGAGGPKPSPLPPRTRTILAVLTYCHAVGIREPRQIERWAAEDETLRCLCAGPGPDRAELVRHLESQREVIEHCLQRVCLVAWRMRFGGWPRRPAEGLPPGSQRIDAAFLLGVAGEVRERLGLAGLRPARPAVA